MGDLEAAKGKPMNLNSPLKKAGMAGNISQCFKSLAHLQAFVDIEYFKTLVNGLKLITGDKYVRNLQVRDFSELVLGFYYIDKFS